MTLPLKICFFVLDGGETHYEDVFEDTEDLEDSLLEYAEAVESVEAASPQFQSSENDSFVLVSTCSLHIAALDFFSFFYQQTSMSYLDFNFIFFKGILAIFERKKQYFNRQKCQYNPFGRCLYSTYEKLKFP